MSGPCHTVGMTGATTRPPGRSGATTRPPGRSGATTRLPRRSGATTRAVRGDHQGGQGRPPDHQGGQGRPPGRSGAATRVVRGDHQGDHQTTRAVTQKCRVFGPCHTAWMTGARGATPRRIAFLLTLSTVAVECTINLHVAGQGGDRQRK